MTKVYSVSVMIQNLLWFAAVVVILVLKIYSYRVIIVFYIIGHVCAGIYLSCYAKEILRYRRVPLVEVLGDIKENIRCGIKLMVATFAGSLVISSVKMIVDVAWGVEFFGFFSFSLTLANVFLNFIKQLSIVVFPALRRVPKERFVQVYQFTRSALSLILPMVMLGYFPIVVFVRLCLPKYIPSLAYLPYFLPICTFDGKMQMMCSSFFKAMRKEDDLLFINLGTLVVSIVLAAIGAFFVRSISVVAIGILVVIAMRSIVSELLLAHYMKTAILRDLMLEIGVVVLFVAGAQVLPAAPMFGVFFAAYAVYAFLNRKWIEDLLEMRG